MAAIFSKCSYSSSIDLSTIKAEGCKEAICTLDQSEHLLSATYAWPAENIWLSRDKDTSGKVNSCVLCTVRANAFCKGNWHLFAGFPSTWNVTVSFLIPISTIPLTTLKATLISKFSKLISVTTPTVPLHIFWSIKLFLRYITCALCYKHKWLGKFVLFLNNFWVSFRSCCWLLMKSIAKLIKNLFSFTGSILQMTLLIWLAVCL